MNGTESNNNNLISPLYNRFDVDPPNSNCEGDASPAKYVLHSK